MTANFFWKGDDFQFLNRLSIASHIVVGHEAIVWLSGDRPKSKYWIDDVKGVIVRDADEISSVDSFLKRGGNLRTASDMWQFKFLYERGGLYCDTDIIALKHFPNDEWIISRDSGDKEGMFAIGIIKAPSRHSVFLECMKNVRLEWHNVNVFTNACKKHNLGLTHPREYFHPFTCGENAGNIRAKRIPILLNDGEIWDAYSIHYFGNKTSRMNIDQHTLSKYPNSILCKICDIVFKDYTHENTMANYR